MTASRRKRHHLIVSSRSRARTQGIARLGGLVMRCALGRSGRRARKREGDGATPAGRFEILGVLYRPDRRRRPVTGLPVRAIRPFDGWCDASGDRCYNRQVRLPYPASHERLWRDDPLYDLVVILDYNINPRKRGAGSAIFMHVARPGQLPTEGCVALDARDLERLLTRLKRSDGVLVM